MEQAMPLERRPLSTSAALRTAPVDELVRGCGGSAVHGLDFYWTPSYSSKTVKLVVGSCSKCMNCSQQSALTPIAC